MRLLLPRLLPVSVKRRRRWFFQRRKTRKMKMKKGEAWPVREILLSVCGPSFP